MATIEISSEEENRDYDDIHSDVDSVVSHNTVSSEEESSGEEAPASISSFASRSGAEWKPITADTVTSGRHAAANVLNPAPGLTAEMMAFMGLLILRGTYRASGEAIEELWSSIHGRPVFPSTMSLNRFKLIRTVLRLSLIHI